MNPIQFSEKELEEAKAGNELFLQQKYAYWESLIRKMADNRWANGAPAPAIDRDVIYKIGAKVYDMNYIDPQVLGDGLW